MGVTVGGSMHLRVPTGWSGQSKALVIQIDNELNALQLRISQLEKKLKEKEATANGNTDDQLSSDQA